jgi:uncharacterized protein YacL (UPF0231 family)
MRKFIGMCCASQDDNYYKNRPIAEVITERNSSSMIVWQYQGLSLDNEKSESALIRCIIVRDAIQSKGRGFQAKEKLCMESARTHAKNGRKEQSIFDIKRSRLYGELAARCLNKIGHLEKLLEEIEESENQKMYLGHIKEANSFLEELKTNLKKAKLEILSNKFDHTKEEKRHSQKIFREYLVLTKSEVQQTFEMLKNNRQIKEGERKSEVREDWKDKIKPVFAESIGMAAEGAADEKNAEIRVDESLVINISKA